MSISFLIFAFLAPSTFRGVYAGIGHEYGKNLDYQQQFRHSPFKGFEILPDLDDVRHRLLARAPEKEKDLDTAGPAWIPSSASSRPETQPSEEHHSQEPRTSDKSSESETSRPRSQGHLEPIAEHVQEIDRRLITLRAELAEIIARLDRRNLGFARNLLDMLSNNYPLPLHECLVLAQKQPISLALRHHILLRKVEYDHVVKDFAIGLQRKEAQMLPADGLPESFADRRSQPAAGEAPGDASSHGQPSWTLSENSIPAESGVKRNEEPRETYLLNQYAMAVDHQMQKIQDGTLFVTPENLDTWKNHLSHMPPKGQKWLLDKIASRQDADHAQAVDLLRKYLELRSRLIIHITDKRAAFVEQHRNDMSTKFAGGVEHSSPESSTGTVAGTPERETTSQQHSQLKLTSYLHPRSVKPLDETETFKSTHKNLLHPLASGNWELRLPVVHPSMTSEEIEYRLNDFMEQITRFHANLERESVKPSQPALLEVPNINDAVSRVAAANHDFLDEVDQLLRAGRYPASLSSRLKRCRYSTVTFIQRVRHHLQRISRVSGKLKLPSPTDQDHRQAETIQRSQSMSPQAEPLKSEGGAPTLVRRAPTGGESFPSRQGRATTMEEDLVRYINKLNTVLPQLKTIESNLHRLPSRVVVTNSNKVYKKLVNVDLTKADRLIARYLKSNDRIPNACFELQQLIAHFHSLKITIGSLIELEQIRRTSREQERNIRQVSDALGRPRPVRSASQGDFRSATVDETWGDGRRIMRSATSRYTQSPGTGHQRQRSANSGLTRSMSQDSVRPSSTYGRSTSRNSQQANAEGSQRGSFQDSSRSGRQMSSEDRRNSRQSQRASNVPSELHSTSRQAQRRVNSADDLPSGTPSVSRSREVSRVLNNGPASGPADTTSAAPGGNIQRKTGGGCGLFGCFGKPKVGNPSFRKLRRRQLALHSRSPYVGSSGSVDLESLFATVSPPSSSGSSETPPPSLEGLVGQMERNLGPLKKIIDASRRHATRSSVDKMKTVQATLGSERWPTNQDLLNAANNARLSPQLAARIHAITRLDSDYRLAVKQFFESLASATSSPRHAGRDNTPAI